ncbi:MAG: hypothetical protein ACI976_002293, partial [Aureispira sp.]
GNKTEWDRAVKIIRQEYKDNNKKLKPNIDEDGIYWLSLDWHMGQFTCNDRVSRMMTLYTSTEQLKKRI